MPLEIMKSAKMDEIVEAILMELHHTDQLDSSVFSFDINDLHSALKKLTIHEYINYKQNEKVKIVLTDAGHKIVEFGSPEFIFYLTVKNPLPKNTYNPDPITLANAFRNGLVEVKDGCYVQKIDNAVDEIRTKLKQINFGIEMEKTDNGTCSDVLSEKGFDKKIGLDLKLIMKDLAILKKRKLIKEIKIINFTIFKGPNYQPVFTTLATVLTSEMIKKNAYKSMGFKPLNFNTKGDMIKKGNFHPMMKLKSEITDIFIELGFTEMRTQKYVESSFWNFDALFQPQDHPSRDLHDTFFVKGNYELDADVEFLNKVKEMHENGGDCGSEGYKNSWSLDIAKSFCLRTHTTAISARYLKIIADKIKEKELNLKFDDLTLAETNEKVVVQANVDKTSECSYNDLLRQLIKSQFCYKFFSIDRVFRNESQDATHLSEFHQVEGLIIGPDLTLQNLMGVLEQFYFKLGMDQIKFKPAYNPYTEPSMEIFGYHKELKKWIEIGNSGMFRPEVLEPMGFDSSNISVLGFGLSLERPGMIKYGVRNIKDLIGEKVDFEFIYDAPICFL